MTTATLASAIARPTLAAARGTAEAEWRAMDGLLRGLEPVAWALPTACHPWTVHDVVAHMVGACGPSPGFPGSPGGRG